MTRSQLAGLVGKQVVITATAEKFGHTNFGDLVRCVRDIKVQYIDDGKVVTVPDTLHHTYIQSVDPVLESAREGDTVKAIATVTQYRKRGPYGRSVTDYSVQNFSKTRIVKA